MKTAMKAQTAKNRDDRVLHQRDRYLEARAQPDAANRGERQEQAQNDDRYRAAPLVAR